MVATQPAMATTERIGPQMLGFTTAKGGNIANTKIAQPKKARDSWGVLRSTWLRSASAVARNAAASLGVGSMVLLKLLSIYSTTLHPRSRVRQGAWTRVSESWRTPADRNRRMGLPQ